MYGHSDTSFPRATAANFLCDFPSLDITTPLVLDQLSATEFDSVHGMLRTLNSESSSGRSSYDSPSSLASYCTQPPSLIQRSVSSYFINESLEWKYGPVRRVYSTGNLEGRNRMRNIGKMNENPLQIEKNAITESMKRARRYNPEKKKEIIERYRSKRNLRNFNKKIKYACRKSLADSRPRIRGRFAKNEEIEKNTQSHINEDQVQDDDDEIWINFLLMHSYQI